MENRLKCLTCRGPLDNTIWEECSRCHAAWERLAKRVKKVQEKGCGACGRPYGFGHTHSCPFVN
jgi:hypothetical protein